MNGNSGSSGDHGPKVTLEIKQKISKSMQKYSSIIGDRSRKALLGKKRSVESKRNQSIAMKKLYKEGVMRSPFRDKEKLALIIKKSRQINQGNKYRLGKMHSEETKKKISLRNKGMVAWNKGKFGVQLVSAETREKLRTSIKLWWKNRKEVN